MEPGGRTSTGPGHAALNVASSGKSFRGMGRLSESLVTLTNRTAKLPSTVDGVANQRRAEMTQYWYGK